MSTVQKNESDSEDDDDYVPPAEAEVGSDSSDDEPDTKRARISSPETKDDDEVTKKQTRDALWSSFEASVSTPPVLNPEPLPKKKIKVEKRYRFAGEEIVEVAEVDEDSADAKTWPVWHAPSNVDASSIAPESSAVPPDAPPSVSSPPNASQKPFGKRPGPRKPKTSLAAVPTTQKAKKLSTLDKSAMDWRAHIHANATSDLKDELEANRRSGGYLEKVEFLKRVDERKEDVMEANKSSKRRRL